MGNWDKGAGKVKDGTKRDDYNNEIVDISIADISNEIADISNEIVDISEGSGWNRRGIISNSKLNSNVEAQSAARGVKKEQEQNLLDLPDNTELVITSVEMLKRPKYRYRISFGEYTIDVHEDVMIKFRMIKGAAFLKSDLTDIVAADERQRAYADAITSLSRKPRTGYEITLRLTEKGWGEETIAEVIQRLDREGLINDAAYAQEWASQRVRSRGKGKLWVKYELRQKGVSKPHIDEALGQVSEEDEFESALLLGKKKWNGMTGEVVDKKRKTGAFLMRRGYSGSLVARVIREISQHDGDSGSEDWEWE